MALQRLLQTYAIHPSGDGLEGIVDYTSGELNVSTSDGDEAYEKYLQQNEQNQPFILNDKTKSDLQKLMSNGFDIHFDDSGSLGEGLYGQVFRGVFNTGINQLNARESSHMGDVRPGQPFAAKYVQFIPTAPLMDRMSHETEKQIMKVLNHPNILNPIVSYDRMFLVMECADCNLNQFCDQKRLNVLLAIHFTRDVCAGMCYMHESGVAHCDPHTGNILIFETPTGPVAKWTDFGDSVGRKQYERLGVTVDDNEFTHKVSKDIQSLAKAIEYMANKARKSYDCVGYDLNVLEDLATDLRTSGKTVAEVLENYTFERFLLPGITNYQF